jgi:hypothetical protein
MSENMNVVIGNKYIVGETECEVLGYNAEKEILFLKEQDGILSFVLGAFKVVDENKIIANSKMSFTVLESEMLNTINLAFANGEKTVNETNVVSAIRNKYYRIPSAIAFEIAKWYLR